MSQGPKQSSKNHAKKRGTEPALRQAHQRESLQAGTVTTWSEEPNAKGRHVKPLLARNTTRVPPGCFRVGV